jgi:hypothetical protein
MNMTAKQWAARAVMAAAMAAGLSACGGGGDSAAPAVAPTPEELTAGLTLRNSSGDSPANGSYTVQVDGTVTDRILTSDGGGAPLSGVTTFIFSDNNVSPKFGGTITFTTADGTVTRALLYKTNLQDKPVACGFDGINHPCTGFKVDVANKKFTATSVILKTVNSDWTGLNTTNPGQVTASGIVSW